MAADPADPADAADATGLSGLSGLWHHAPKLPLLPWLLWQGRRVRAQALRLPEAAGERQGRIEPSRWDDTAQGIPLSLLIIGDSSAAGVGVGDQSEALAGCLAAALSAETGLPVRWQLLATSGHTAADALDAFKALPAVALQPAQLLVTALGVNDAVAQRSPATWLATLDALTALAGARAGVRQTWHCGLPDVGAFPLLPQPLRWVLGRDARRLDAALQAHLAGRQDRRHVPLPALPAGQEAVASGWMAVDGFHPGPAGYRAWGQGLAAEIARGLRA